MITIEIRLKKLDEAIMLGESLQNIEMAPKQRRSIDQKLEHAKKLVDMKNNDSKDNKEDLKSLRNNLYEGKIETSQVKELVEQYGKTAKGCILIAEVCKYFRLEELGIKCLKGYKRQNATTISRCEQKAISQAMELLNQKKEIVSLREKWDKVYDTLEKTSEVETYSCEGK